MTLYFSLTPQLDPNETEWHCLLLMRYELICVISCNYISLIWLFVNIHNCGSEKEKLLDLIKYKLWWKHWFLGRSWYALNGFGPIWDCFGDDLFVALYCTLKQPTWGHVRNVTHGKGPLSVLPGTKVSLHRSKVLMLWLIGVLTYHLCLENIQNISVNIIISLSLDY